MKIYNFRIIVMDLLKRWYLVLLLAVICGGVLGLYGYKSAKNTDLTQNPELEEQWELYENAIKEYEQSVEDTQKALDDNSAILNDLNAYIDNSVYMKINSQDVKTSSGMYAVHAGEGVDFNLLISAYYLYVTGGSVCGDIAAQGISIEEQYLRELITWSNSYNTFTITVIAPDEETSAEIFKACDNALTGKYDEFREAYGYYELALSDETHYSRVDTGIMGAQDGQLNARRSYQTTQSDLENRLVSVKGTLANHIENGKPETEPGAESPMKKLIKFGVFGFVLGLILAFMISFMSYFFGRRLKSTKDLAAVDLDVLAVYDSKKGFNPQTDDVLTALKMYCDMAGKSKMCLMTVAETEEIKKVYGDLSETAKKTKTGPEVTSADYYGSRADVLAKLTESGQTVLVLQKGRSTYADIENSMKLCGQFDVKVRGCIVLQ
ncbi:MAG: hypothetical protein K5929_01465 [Lachnospiraceae bacterium]|nr:hypothetical protein [Lachnospiraceae bacterium]